MNVMVGLAFCIVATADLATLDEETLMAQCSPQSGVHADVQSCQDTRNSLQKMIEGTKDEPTGDTMLLIVDCEPVEVKV